MGDKAQSAGIGVTVNGVSTEKALGRFSQPKLGSVYVIADITVENLSRDSTPYNPLYFKVKDTDGFEYTTALVVELSNGLKSGELAKGDKARGTVAFEIPEKAAGLVLSYQPLVIFGGYEVIRVALQ